MTSPQASEHLVDGALGGTKAPMTLAFLLLLYVGLVGHKPLAAPVAVTVLDRSSTPIWFQVIFLTTYTLTIVFGLKAIHLKTFLLFSPPVLLIFIWGLFSLLWSNYPSIAAIALLRCTLLCAGAAICISTLGAERSWRILGIFLAAVTLINYIAMVVSPYAIHSALDWDTRLIGAWRGIHEHKNIAAPIAFYAALYWIIRYLDERRLSQLLISAAAAIFMIGTDSKTTIAFAFVSFCILVFFQLFRRNGALVKITLWFFAIFAVLFLTVLLSDDAVQDFFLLDGAAFSGRSALWEMVLNTAATAPVGGVGFSSFWRVGLDGPTYDYAVGWFAASYSGHNGYLDLLVTLGIPGMTLAIMGLCIWPLLDFTRWGSLDDPISRLSFIGLLFAAMHNLLESTFMVASSESFLLWLICACSLRKRALDQGTP